MTPRRIFRGVSDHETLSWHQVVLAAVVIGLADISLHFYFIYGVWIVHVFPGDWIPFAAGWVCLAGNTWLLGVLGLLVLNRAFGGTVRAPGAVFVTCFHLVVALWVIAVCADAVHRVFHIAPVRLEPAWLGWLGGPIIGLWVHAAWFVEGPWLVVALWLVFRHVLGVRGFKRIMVACLVMAALPVGGRLIVEGLPNVGVFLLRHVAGWHPTSEWSVVGSHGGGWVVLGAQATLLAVVGPIVRATVTSARRAFGTRGRDAPKAGEPVATLPQLRA